jgi:hypothetical protein
MDCKILENGDMKFTIDAEDRELLKTLEAEDPDHFKTDAFMYDWFESFVANNEYQWVRPEECGALTSAPMLGIYAKERELREGENTDFLSVVGHWDNKTWVQDVESVWAFMDYLVISVQERLMRDGEAVLTRG